MVPVIWWVFSRLDRERWKGTFLVWFVFLYGMGRPLSEFFRAAEKREPFLGNLTASQLVCMVAALAAGIYLLALFNRSRGIMPSAD